MQRRLQARTVLRRVRFASRDLRNLSAECIRPDPRKGDAVNRIGEFKPYKLRTPLRLDMRFKRYRPSELLSFLSKIERTASDRARLNARDLVEASKFLEFILNYEPGLEP